ncbi:ATP-binding protein (plasmid) [Adhaeribacter swui]|uniref:ATP-binding protein n=1 Tax=Adhaeribacter swui TaxID=2086471 RepID=A0A7G7G2C1_9BACT|nr:ATP-binding protein [Adhaeribacter swui]QNF31305.1 ATP-binding protein [Adhaeribacter swui]
MIDNIKPKEATAIINSLLGGVVPKIGLQHITVGRSAEVEAFISSLEDVKNGHSMVKFWIGDFGSGKSFMMHLLNTVALKQKFVVANADFTPDNRLYANDGKAVALYSAIMDNIAIQTKPEGGALVTLLEKWIEQIITKTAQDKGISLADIKEEQHLPAIQNNIVRTINEITEVGGFDFGMVVMKYYEGYIKDDEQLRRSALKWLKGEYRTKTEARQDLGVREIIHDLNYYDMLKNFCKLFVSMGYSGFMINLDEAINLYKISTTVIREKNYEKILTIYNDCFQGKVSNFFINFAGTQEVLENERRGLFSYHALKSRLGTNKFETLEVRDFSQPVIRLLPLNHNEIFVLLKKLKAIFDFNYKVQLNITDEEIQLFMEEIFNKPGASEFLTPREVIRDFLNILSIIRQNPGINKQQLFGEIEIRDERPGESAVDSLVDSIEVL